MDEDTIVTLGDYCEKLLQTPSFQILSSLFEQQAVNELLSTKPTDTTQREFIYSRVCAHREFLTMLGNYIQQKNELLEPQKDHLDDDPGVHDIYKGILD